MANRSEESFERRNTDVAARLQSLRNMLNTGRHISAEQQRALDTIDREAADREAANRSLEQSNIENRRRDLEAHLREHESSSLTDTPPIVRARRRIFRPSERLQRAQDRRERLALLEPSVGSYRPLSPAFTPFAARSTPSTQPAPHLYNDGRSKRRKLSDGTFEDDSADQCYGNEGRVVAGPLKLQIVSCDGGEHEACSSEHGSRLDHLLWDDEVVYSTKRNKCNLLLKHTGGMPFALTKILFKVPKEGYDAPAQQGMIFVTMYDDNLVERAIYYDKYSPRSYWYHSARRYGNPRPSHEYLHSVRSPPRSYERLRHTRYPPTLLPQVEERESDEPPRVQGFDVSYDFPSDTEPEDQNPRSPQSWQGVNSGFPFRAYADRWRPDSHRTERHLYLSSPSGSEEEDVPLYRGTQTEREVEEAFNARRRRMIESMRRSQQRAQLNASDLYTGHWIHNDAVDSGNDDLRATLGDTHQPPEAVPTPARVPSRSSKRLPGASLANAEADAAGLVPHARFSIYSGRSSSVAVNFDPPVSGRYILIKLWAACPNNNIDIQSIIPYGFGGPRMFPIQEFR